MYIRLSLIQSFTLFCQNYIKFFFTKEIQMDQFAIHSEMAKIPTAIQKSLKIA